jgi:uncharacterized protein DUF4386
VCAILIVVCFVVAIPLMAGSGVQVLIPETGNEGIDWIMDVDAAGGAFYVGAWLTILGGYFGLVALVGFYEPLKGAGPAMILAPILGAVGLTIVTISHLIPIALAYELVPDYVAADGASKASIAPTLDTLASTSQVLNSAGNALGWGVVVPMYAYAVLKTRAVPRWIGWLGIFVAVTGGWLGLLSPASSVLEAVTFPGFVAFFVFMASMGVALLRKPAAT